MSKSFLDLFKPSVNPEEITASGFNWTINWSNIQSKIICLAGRYCDHYASDILFDIGVIEGRIRNQVLKTSTFLFGFHECGCDSNSFILSRYQDAGMYSNYCGEAYRSIWRLDVTVNDEGDIKMKFYNVDKCISPSRVEEALKDAQVA